MLEPKPTFNPDDLPKRWGDKMMVTHSFPDEWSEREIRMHRFGSCPCHPVMRQNFNSCGHDHGGYHWTVDHQRRLRTDSP